MIKFLYERNSFRYLEFLLKSEQNEENTKKIIEGLNKLKILSSTKFMGNYIHFFPNGQRNSMFPYYGFSDLTIETMHSMNLEDENIKKLYSYFEKNASEKMIEHFKNVFDDCNGDVLRSRIENEQEFMDFLQLVDKAYITEFKEFYKNLLKNKISNESLFTYFNQELYKDKDFDCLNEKIKSHIKKNKSQTLSFVIVSAPNMLEDLKNKKFIEEKDMDYILKNIDTIQKITNDNIKSILEKMYLDKNIIKQSENKSKNLKNKI